MDWSIFVYFLAAVVAAGVSYAVWPKDHRPKLKISDATFKRPAILKKTPVSNLVGRIIERVPFEVARFV